MTPDDVPVSRYWSPIAMEARRFHGFLTTMSRTLRPQMPGIAFHITARTQGKAPWFEERIRSTIEKYIVDGVTSSDATLMAHTVMPNHFHIVLRQGSWPLGRVMQPVQRRIALLVQRAHDMKGHVFERPFRSYACENADYLRRAIVYTHINAYRARLCRAARDYPWMSHNRLIIDAVGGVTALEIVHTLKLFGDEPGRTITQLRDNYVQYLNWRIAKDEQDAAGAVFDAREPFFPAGDKHFATSFCALPSLNRIPQVDLRDKAIALLHDIDKEALIDDLRHRSVRRAVSATRRQLICGLLQYGFRGKQIAEFFRISDTAVSVVASAMRWARPS